MPVRYVCRHCGELLWEFKHVGQDCYGLPTPTEVMNVYGGICPRCKRELHKPSRGDIVVRIAGKASREASYRVVQGVISSSPTTESSYTAEA